MNAIGVGPVTAAVHHDVTVPLCGRIIIAGVDPLHDQHRDLATEEGLCPSVPQTFWVVVTPERRTVVDRKSGIDQTGAVERL